MDFRPASSADLRQLALMNKDLIRDEGHRNPMTVAELEARMGAFIREQYQVVLFEQSHETMGYALYKPEQEWTYLRQFFVKPEFRRRGIGREAFRWLLKNRWYDCPCLRLDVLAANPSGQAFWRALGFLDYCVTLELPVAVA